MKVNKYFLSKIIKEEIKNILYEETSEAEKHANALKRINQMRDASKQDPLDPIIRKLDKLFIRYRDILMNDPTRNQELVVDFQKLLKRISPELKGPEILHLLDGKIDRQLLSFVADLLKHDPRMPHGGYSLPDYEMPLELGREQGVMPYNRGQTDAFMRAPQHNGPYDDEEQIDDRDGKKNLVHENTIRPLEEIDMASVSRESFEPSGYYGIVTEMLQDLSDEEKNEFKYIQAFWLDPLIGKQTTSFLRNGDYNGLVKKVGQIMNDLNSGQLKLDYSAVEDKLEKPPTKFAKETIEKLVWNNEKSLNKIGIVDTGVLGSGTDGVAFSLQNGKVLKVTTNKPEAEACNKLLKQNKSLSHVVKIFDVFYFTKAQLPQMSEQSDITKPQRIRPQEQKPVSKPEEKPEIKQPQKQEGFSIETFQQISKKFKLPEMLSQLKSVGIKFSDFHEGNLMKRGADYVINDLGRSEGGLAVLNPLKEKKNFLKKLILEVINEK